MKPTLTVCILTKNDAINLGILLPELTAADELLIIDDNSTDETASIATSYGATVVKRALKGDFSRQRNFGLKKAKGKWVLFLDPDERATSTLIKEIRKIIANPDKDGYYLERHDVFLGRVLKRAEAGKTRLLRLGRKGTGWWKRRVHEVWEIKKTGMLVTPILHYAHKNPETFNRKVKRYAKLEARYRFEQQLPWSLFEYLVYPPAKFLFNYLICGGFLDGKAGFWYALRMSQHSRWVRQNLYTLYYGVTVHPFWQGWRYLFYALWVMVALGQVTRFQITPTTAVYGFEVIMGILTIFGGVKLLIEGRWQWFRLGQLALIFWLLLGVSLAANLPILGLALTAKASLYWWRLLIYLVFGWTTALIYFNRYLKFPLSRILLYVGTFISIAGLLQYLWLPDLRWLYTYGWDDHYFRLASTLLDPGFTGLILVLTLLLLEWKRGERWRYYWTLVFGTMLLTYSRSSYAAYVTGELLQSLFIKKFRGPLLRIFSMIFLLFWLPRPPSEGTRLLRTYSIESRAQSSITSWDVYKENPLFGVGFNAYRFYTQPPEETLDKPVHPSSPDNSFLLILATAGVVGMTGFIVFLYGLWPHLKRNLLLTLSVGAVATHAIFNNSIFYPTVMLWLMSLTINVLVKENSSR